MSSYRVSEVQVPYVHPAARLRQEIVERGGSMDSELMTKREFSDQVQRDVSSFQGAPMAEVCPDPDTGTVTFILDSRTAALAMDAIKERAANYEAHALEVRAAAGRLPTASYGRKNREETAERNVRLARRLGVIVLAYGNVVETAWHGF